MQTDNGIRLYENISELIDDLGGDPVAEENRILNIRSNSITDVIHRTRLEPCIILYTATGPILWPDDTAHGHDAEITDLYTRLVWGEEILHALRDVERTLSMHKATAVHVRRGDLISLLSYSLTEFKRRKVAQNFAHRYVPLDAYIQCIESEAPSGLLTFFSDDEASIEELSSRYPGRVVDGRIILDSFRLSEPQRALVEFILISRARMVIGGGSQFCQLPSKLGGIQCVNPMRYASVTSIVSDVAGLITSGEDRDERVALVLEEFAKSFRRLGMSTDFSALLRAASDIRQNARRASGP
jgi:hypothetical protein